MLLLPKMQSNYMQRDTVGIKQSLMQLDCLVLSSLSLPCAPAATISLVLVAIFIDLPSGFPSVHINDCLYDTLLLNLTTSAVIYMPLCKHLAWFTPIYSHSLYCHEDHGYWAIEHPAALRCCFACSLPGPCRWAPWPLSLLYSGLPLSALLCWTPALVLLPCCLCSSPSPLPPYFLHSDR